jgi:hypothetical protein
MPRRKHKHTLRTTFTRRSGLLLVQIEIAENATPGRLLRDEHISAPDDGVNFSVIYIKPRFAAVIRYAHGAMTHVVVMALAFSHEIDAVLLYAHPLPPASGDLAPLLVEVGTRSPHWSGLLSLSP